MEPGSFLKDFQNQLREIKSRFASDLKTFQTGRAHASLLDGVLVEVYGSKMPLNQVASVLATEAALLQVTPFDTANITAICNAISADEKLNFNPTDDGRAVYVAVPPLTTERREQIAKNLNALREDFLIRLRQARHQIIKKLKEESVAEEEASDLNKEIEALAGGAKTEIENLASEKTKEILEL